MTDITHFEVGSPEKIQEFLMRRAAVMDASVEFALKKVGSIEPFISFGDANHCTIGKVAATSIIQTLGISTRVISSSVTEHTDDKGKFWIASVLIEGKQESLGFCHEVEGTCSTRHKFHGKTGVIVDGERVSRFKDLSEIDFMNVKEHAKTQAYKKIVKLVTGKENFSIEYIEKLFPGQKVKRQEFQKGEGRHPGNQKQIEKHLHEIILENTGGDENAAIETLKKVSSGIINKKSGKPYEFKDFQSLEKYPGIENMFIDAYIASLA